MAPEIVTDCKNDKTQKNYQEYAHDKGTRDKTCLVLWPAFFCINT